MSFKRHAGNYALVGLVQWVVDYGVMLLLSEWVMPVEPANFIGRFCGAALGYWLNGVHTFKGEHTSVGRQQLIRFAWMWLGLTVGATWLIGVIDDQFGLRIAQLSKPAVDFLSGTMGFFLSRHWVYRKA